jgi:hypothetical protein
VRAGNLANLYLLIANCGVAKIFGKAFVHPKRKFAEIETKEGVGIFVIDHLVGIFALDIGANDDEVAFFAGDIEASGMRVAFGLPEAGEKGFEGVFVLEGEDEDGLAEVGAEVGKGGVKDFADLLELGGDAAGFAFAGVADDDEVGGADFEPVVEMVGGGEGGREEEAEKEQREGEAGERHEMVLEGDDGEVKGEGKSTANSRRIQRRGRQELHRVHREHRVRREEGRSKRV